LLTCIDACAFQVQEISIDYSECHTKAPYERQDYVPTYSATFKNELSTPPTWERHNDSSGATVCTLYFSLPNDLPAPVFMYYRLTNFYQNHRRYVQSLDLNQLKGDAVSYNTIKGGACDPLATDAEAKKAYYPCGLIANSMFNDTIGQPQILSGSGSDKKYYNMTKKGIAWASDKELIKQTKYKPGEVLPPQNWAKYNGTYTEMPNLHEDEDFMVWMRTAGLPSFSKLSRRNDVDTMPKGSYSLDIVHRMSF
jgi:hypothetical protein